MKPTKGNTIKLHICPKCKSTNVGYTFHLKNLFGIIPRMECKSCKHKAPIFPLLIIDKNKINVKQNKKSKKK